jgi:hypothetical protein
MAAEHRAQLPGRLEYQYTSKGLEAGPVNCSALVRPNFFPPLTPATGSLAGAQALVPIFILPGPVGFPVELRCHQREGPDTLLAWPNQLGASLGVFPRPQTLEFS